jgi:hypothetical protein
MVADSYPSPPSTCRHDEVVFVDKSYSDEDHSTEPESVVARVANTCSVGIMLFQVSIFIVFVMLVIERPKR